MSGGRVPRGRAWRLRVPLFAPVLVLLLGLGACTPLYLPPVPERVPVHEVAQLGDASALGFRDRVLTLHVVLDRIPEAGWLAVQWFAPDGSEVASDSVWVAPADVGEGRTLALPSRVSLSAGEWRAVVSFRGDVLRQFRATVPASTP